MSPRFAVILDADVVAKEWNAGLPPFLPTTRSATLT